MLIFSHRPHLVAATLGVDKHQDGLHERRGEGLQHERAPLGLLRDETGEMQID